MTATTEKKEITLKPDVQALAEKIRQDMKLDKTGVAVVSPDLYVQTLPEGLTKETVKLLSEHNSRWVAAGGLALGQESIPVMKKHKDLNQTTLVVPTIGKDNFAFAFDRSKEVRAPGAEESTTKYGILAASLNIYNDGANVGEVKKVKQLLSNEALEAFGS